MTQLDRFNRLNMKYKVLNLENSKLKDHESFYWKGNTIKTTLFLIYFALLNIFPKKSNAQEIFWILEIKVFKNDNFHAGQVVKQNFLVCTLTFRQYYT